MVKNVLRIGVFVGLLDALAALINTYLSSGIMPYLVFQYISSGLIGKSAYQSLYLPVALGLIIHFSIAITVTFIFYHVYKRIGKASTPKLLLGSLYGIGIWVGMHYVVIPLSLIGTYPENPTQIVIGLIVHIFVIGIPIEMLMRRSITKKSSRE